MEAKTEKKGNIIDAFVGGARNGFKIGTNSMVPNIIFGFAVISILNLTGLMEIIGKVFTRSWESLDSRVLLQQHGWQFLYLWEEPQVLSPDFLRLDR